jgi:hypothetical protein
MINLRTFIEIKLKLFFVVFIIIISLLLSFNYLTSYYTPKIIYNFSQDANIKPFPPSSILQETENPFEMKSNVNYNMERPNSDRIEVNYERDFIIHNSRNGTLSPMQLLPSDLLINAQVKLEDVPIKLFEKPKEICTEIKEINLNTQTITRGNCQEKMYYFTPNLSLEGNEKVNKLEIHFLMKNDLTRISDLEVPYFFKKDVYSVDIVMPAWGLYISPYSNYSEVYSTFELKDKNSPYHIVEEESGWMTRYIEIVGNTVKGSVINSKNQTSELLSNDKLLSNHIEMSKENSPELFRIIFIPELRLFLLPFIFLWAPILNILFSAERSLKGILYLYSMILAFLGITNFNGLQSFNIVYPYSFYFFNNYFIIAIYLFPLIYLILYNHLTNKMKRSVQLLEYGCF